MKRFLFTVMLLSGIQLCAQNIGIGTPSPQTRLDISGTNAWDLLGSEGDLRIGNGTYRLKMGVALVGGGAGSANIMQYGAPGGYNALSLGSQGNYLFRLYGETKVVEMATDAASKVVIGNATPVEKLDVIGNIRATGYKLSAPVTQYYTIPDGEFTGRLGTDIVHKSFSNGGTFVDNGSQYGVVAPIHLPQNAKIISIKADFYDASVAQDINLRLIKQFQSGVNFEAEFATSGSIGVNTQTFILPTPLTIDNSQYAYQVFVAPVSGNWINFDLAIRRVFITYTIDAL